MSSHFATSGSNSSYSYSSSSVTGGDGKFFTTHQELHTTQHQSGPPTTVGSQSYSVGRFDESGEPIVQQSDSREIGQHRLNEGRDEDGRQRIEEL